MQDKFEDYALYAAWQTISAATVKGVIDSVRNRVLEFSLRLEQEAPNAGEAAAAGRGVPQSAITHLYQNIIVGNQTIGNIASASPGAMQTAIVTHNDLGGLKKLLVESGVPTDDVNELATALQEEKGTPGIGPKTAGWLARASAAVASGAWKLGSGVTIGIITKYVLHYLGMP
jgi:hypothetical protein